MKKHLNLGLIMILASLAVAIIVQQFANSPGAHLLNEFDTLGDDGEVNKDLPVVPMKLGSRAFKLEVADAERKRQLGLMNRRSMSPDHGMIFVFQEDLELNFWMKNTLIPLDVIYIDAKGKVANIDQMEARDIKTKHPSKGAVRYAIELNKGMAAKAGLKAGDVVEIPKLE
jgi:hypothetical protein